MVAEAENLSTMWSFFMHFGDTWAILGAMLGILEAGRFQEYDPGAPGTTLLGPFGATCTILAPILGPAGRQGAPKIKYFGTKSPTNREK